MEFPALKTVVHTSVGKRKTKNIIQWLITFSHIFPLHAGASIPV
jgi:hypothetical protein